MPDANALLARRLRTALVRWWRGELRDMPWRRTSDPYAIWVSEVMLQQTQAQTVKAYYERFLNVFPTVQSLASAERAKVLKAWEGLGYYQRARNLHRGARVICKEYAGLLPADPKLLGKVPGIGDYTAGAIASIAFGLPVPAIDGNVSRVAARLLAMRQDPRQARGKAQLLGLLVPLLELGRPGDINQALMDLGASVCKPVKPDCGRCPVGKYCQARAKGLEGKLPLRRPRKAVPHFDVVAGVIWRAGRILIDRRRDEGLLGGLWELPGGKVSPGETHEQALVREVREELGIRIEVGEVIDTVQHAYSHFRITMRVYNCRHVGGRPRAIGCSALRWVWPSQLGHYAFPAANKRVVARLMAGG